MKTKYYTLVYKLNWCKQCGYITKYSLSYWSHIFMKNLHDHHNSDNDFVTQIVNTNIKIRKYVLMYILLTKILKISSTCQMTTLCSLQMIHISFKYNYRLVRFNYINVLQLLKRYYYQFNVTPNWPFKPWGCGLVWVR